MRWPRRTEDDTTLGELLDGSSETEPLDGTGTVEHADPWDEGRGAPDGTGNRGPAQDSEVEAAFLDEEDYLPQERRGPSRLTVGLVAALVLLIGAFGGIWLEKQLGRSSAGFPAAAGAAPSGFPGASGGQAPGSGGFPGGAQPGGQASAGVPDAGGPTGTQGGDTGGGSGGTAPAVVGTVSSLGKGSVVVTDLGGTKHTVTVGASTTVTGPYGHGALAKGDTVSVTGTSGSDGSVDATGITVR